MKRARGIDADRKATPKENATNLQNNPWLDLRLTKEAMDYLWDSINDKQTTAAKDVRPQAGSISKSMFIQDKNDWFYKNVLKECTETIYFKDWNNYYNVHITQSAPLPAFVLYEMWVNYQKQHEFNPPHNHIAMFSFVVFMQIPTHWKEQHALHFSEVFDVSCASDFQFLLGHGNGQVQLMYFPLCPEDEGRMLFFPAWLHHQVFPFYGTEKERITVSGNIIFTADDK